MNHPAGRPKLALLTYIAGALTLLVGVLFLTVPAIVRPGNEWLLALILICGGVTSAAFSVSALRTDVKIYTLLLAVLSLCTGLIVLVHPLDTFITLTTLLGFYFMFESALMGGLGMNLRPHWRAAIWPLMLSAISLVLSASIWMKLAGSPKAVIVILLGISFVARGAVYIAMASIVRTQAALPANTPPPGGQASAAEI
jgi:uncharacterized membrane protein HdeD (DUF308 family)